MEQDGDEPRWSPHRLSGGAYVNYLGADTTSEAVQSAYGPVAYTRLVALKDHYDPTDVFRLNQNVRPVIGGHEAYPQVPHSV